MKLTQFELKKYKSRSANKRVERCICSSIIVQGVYLH